jgi:small subunit ribosomal protein S14
MSRRSLNKNLKDYYNRRAFINIETKRIVFKAIYNNGFVSKRMRKIAYAKICKMHKYGSPTRFKNRCILTGHTRSILSKFKMGRCQFSELANSGQLFGVKKASW